MVKRKAEISLDEWLIQGVRSAEIPSKKTGEAQTKQPHDSGPVTNNADSGAPAEQSAAAELVASLSPLEGDRLQVTEAEAHAWFWALLAQAGYEPL